MIPKLYVKENGYMQPTYQPMPMLHGMVAPMPPNYLVNAGFMPPNEAILQAANGEMDSLLQSHRRKMLRRAANRRSAQLSRARKKVSLAHIVLSSSLHF